MTAIHPSCYELQDMAIDNCAICLGAFIQPKTLQCHHSFCSDCLQLLIQHRQSDWYLTCPKCCRVHTKVSVYQLPVNEELKAALEGGTEANSIRAYKRCSVALKQVGRVSDDRFIFHKAIHSVLILPDFTICMSTDEAVYFFQSKIEPTPQLVHKRESRNVRSMALLNNEVYIIECLEEVKWTGDYFSSWIITVLNNHGDYVRQFYAGLGEEARIYSLSNQDGIVVCDSGSYRHHAKPCIITMSPEGSKRHHLETTRRLLKPEVVLETALPDHLVILDSGRRELSCYNMSSNSNHLKDVVWTHKSGVNSVVTRYDTEKSLLLLTNSEIHVINDFGRLIRKIVYSGNQPARSIAVNGFNLAIASGTACQLYHIITETRNERT